MWYQPRNCEQIVRFLSSEESGLAPSGIDKSVSLGGRISSIILSERISMATVSRNCRHGRIDIGRSVRSSDSLNMKNRIAYVPPEGSSGMLSLNSLSLTDPSFSTGNLKKWNEVGKLRVFVYLASSILRELAPKEQAEKQIVITSKTAQSFIK